MNILTVQADALMQNPIILYGTAADDENRHVGVDKAYQYYRDEAMINARSCILAFLLFILSRGVNVKLKGQFFLFPQYMV